MTEDELIQDLIDEYTTDIVSETDVNGDVLDEIAESYGYRAYKGDEGYSDVALMMNVKGMPDLRNLDMEISDEDLYFALDSFIDYLHEEFGKDFTIRGRMSGYWGLSDMERHLTLSEAGKQAIADELKEVIHNEDNEEDWQNAKDDEERYNIARDCLVYDMALGDRLLNDSAEYWELKPKFLNKMNRLKETIENEEEAMQNKIYWNDLRPDYSDESKISMKKTLKSITEKLKVANEAEVMTDREIEAFRRKLERELQRAKTLGDVSMICQEMIPGEQTDWFAGDPANMFEHSSWTFYDHREDEGNEHIQYNVEWDFVDKSAKEWMKEYYELDDDDDIVDFVDNIRVNNIRVEIL